MELLLLYLPDTGERIYVEFAEYNELVKRLKSLGVKHTMTVVTEKTYRITWYDPTKEKWRDAWCDDNKYVQIITAMIEASIEFKVKIYNQ